MHIQVTAHVRISRDDTRNWTIQTLHIPETGKRAGQEIWKTAGYYSSPGSAAGALLDRKIDLILEEPPEVFNELRDFQRSIEAAHRKVYRALKSSKRKLAKKARSSVEEE